MPSKSELRQQMKSVRAELSASDRAEASRLIAQTVLNAVPFSHAESWFVYVSFRSEVATHAIIDELVRRQRQVYVPRTGDDGLMRAVEFPGWDRMMTERFGFLAPPANAIDAAQLDLCLCPGLAFTAPGDRLGYGQGHYDRFLQRWPTLTTVGLAFAAQLVTSIDTESTDRRMNWLVTEKGLTQTTNGATA